MPLKLIRNLPPKGKQIITTMNQNQGFGMVKGITKQKGNTYSHVTVCIFRRDNRLLLWETASNEDGSYFFRNLAVGLECFVIAFDPNKHFNALIQDRVVVK